MTCPTAISRELHEPTDAESLGYHRRICATCGVDWPCVNAVKDRCVRFYLANGLPCDCGHHEDAEVIA